MTTTPSTASASQSAAPAQAATPQRANGGPAAPADLFASLLALVADAPALADTPALTPTKGQPGLDEADEGTDGTAADPLAALLAWVTPGLAPAAAGPAAAGTRDTTPNPHAGGPDIPPLTAETRRIDGAAERPGAIELPATAAPGARAAAPAWLAGALRNGQAGPDRTAVAATAATAAGSDVAMRWQRGASAEHASSTGLAMRSTVALGERATANSQAPWAVALRESTTDDALPGASPVHGTRQGSDGLATGAPGAGTGTEAGNGDSATADSGHPDNTPDTKDPATEALWRDEAAEEAVEVNHWGSGNLRNASLRVGEAGEQAIDIQLSVRGDEVQVAFRTDDEQARDLLRQQADTSLADLLQGSGMQLGGVSVGAQGEPSSGRENASRSTLAHAASRTPAAEPVAAAAPVRTRADGGPALDLFI